MTTPFTELGHLWRTDPTAPRLTWYDLRSSERLELSGRVLVMWASKAAGLLEDEAAAWPGVRVALDLPVHWRAAYWGLAAWAVGGCVDVTGPLAPDVLVTSSATAAAAGRAGTTVLVTLPALARSHPGGAAPGVLDEAATVGSFPDRYVAVADPAPTDLALVSRSGAITYRDVVAPRRAGRVLVAPHSGETAAALHTCLQVWSGGGSVVLVSGYDGTDDDAAAVDRIGVAERITATDSAPQ